MISPQVRTRGGVLTLAAVLLAVAPGCASTPRDPDARASYDPFEPLNRKVWAFNQAADRVVLRPVARGYDKVMPRPVKSGVTNILNNLSTPIWVLNHLLQGNLPEAGKQTGRFVLNSTLGLLGILDPGEAAGLRRKSASFDQTFGKWGVPAGPFVMMPFLGPSSVRDGVGMYARYRTDVVWNYLDDERSIRDKLMVLEIIDTRRRLLPLDNMIERAPDSYIFVREAYRQRAEFEIRGPGGQDDDISLDFEDEDWGDDEF